MNATTFTKAHAITRSLLGWGVVAGPFYVAVGLVLALTRPGFDLSRHPLSLLMLGDNGWMQITTIILSGVMTLAAAVGFARAMAGRAAAILVGVFGVCLIGSGVFPPDPMAGFPVGAAQVATFSGIGHLVFGAIGFVCLGAAAIVAAKWFDGRGARWSRIAGAVVILGFVGGGALSASPAGVASLWLAVIVGWAWLLVACRVAYRTVPDPTCA